MMEACHERVQRTLGLLQRLAEHMARHGADDQARQAARDVMRYFDMAAPEHHRDEELHVFPPLVAEGDAATLQVVKRLQDDHVKMESGWAAARAVLARIAEGQLAALSDDDAAKLASFGGLYGRHIEDEEKIAYPQARTLLDDATVKAMGAEMSKRRGN
ncbi:MAG: hemerythrin domain-containing protein [Burkholderiales bacterium]|nr:hemerythrin domain-containing protein [Burkholderiales bacterium]